ncbi:glycosyltransferase family 39 protein [Myxococcota bacterium]|nr:glycosyltransferase family 39 protein [Myxococcota bacterium]
MIFATLSLTTAWEMGLVGEVAIGWGLGAPPPVVVSWDGPTLADGVALGPLVSAQVRPVERLDLFGLSLPVAVNHYTGGPPDWPARLLFAITGSLAAVSALHLALGAVFIGLCHRFLRFHGSSEAAPLAALLLATDWSFVFYRRALGGTELLLLGAGLLCLWSFWSRRWSGGRHGTVAFAVGVGLGLLAKATFVATLGALGAAILLTRGDRPARLPPDPPRWALLVALPALLTAPLWLTALHHQLEPIAGPQVVSHDLLGLQLDRAAQGLEALFSGERGPSREAPSTLGWFLLSPLPFFESAYDATPTPVSPVWRLMGWGLVLGGTAWEWLSRSNSPSGALLRFMSVYAPLQLGALWLANRDLHHLAQAGPSVILWSALALDRLAGLRGAPRSATRALWGLVLAAPMMVGGVLALRGTDTTLVTGKAPHLTTSGQAALVEALRAAPPCTITTADYELYGLLDLLTPERRLLHAWGDISRRAESPDEALASLLRGSVGECVLIVRSSAPMIYNLRPSPKAMRVAAESVGLEVTTLTELSDGRGAWAWLYQINEGAAAAPPPSAPPGP